MPEELSPESKLFVKEEIEKIRKDIKEEVEKVKSKTTKIFTTVVVVVGLLTGLGVYGGVKSYINKELEGGTLKKLEDDAKAIVDKIESHEAQAKKTCDFIAERKKDANDIVFQLTKSFDQRPARDGYAWFGNILFQWGVIKSTNDEDQRFPFNIKFPNKCFVVITSLPGTVFNWNQGGFSFNRLDDYNNDQYSTYGAIGN